MDGMIIITRTMSNINQSIQNAPDSGRLIPQSQIVILDANRPEGSARILTSAFYSARSPEIACDGRHMLFTGQQKQIDPWQVWEMDLSNSKVRQITSSKENCTDPAYLPVDRLVFSKFSTNDSLKAEYSLFTCKLDGSNLTRITFNPHTYFASRVLSDGRVLTIGKQIFPVQADPAYIVMRPDGTKAELFYDTSDKGILTGPGLETVNGRIVFIESGKQKHAKGDIISIGYTRPLHSRINLTSGIEGDFHAVFPEHSGKFMVSYRKSETNRYSLFEFDPETKTIGREIYSSKDYDVIDAAVVWKHDRQKKLPSEVDMGVKTGLLLCQDVNVVNSLNSINSKAPATSSRIEIVGIDSTLGRFDVAADGSFYLKVMADKPFRIQTVDKDGHITRDPCGWIWIRPNERRGCVGCHEDHEMVPENRVPLAVKKSPVVIPMHLNKIVEKKVSLE